MSLPLSLSDISLWLAFVAIILLATSELLSPNYGKTTLLINKKRLRKAALIPGVLFICTILIHIYGITTVP